ncbi:MAG: polysaccharide deacetylase family protein [Pirellulales bacterium]
MKATNNGAGLAADRCEAQSLDHAQRDCYCATSSRFSSLSHDGGLYRPFLDEQRLAAGDSPPIWPNGAPFAVCLTHDVDNVAWHTPLMHLRQVRNRAPAAALHRESRAIRGLGASAVDFFTALARRRRADPLFCYEHWLEMEATVGARSTFLFLPNRYGKRHYSDGGYRYDDRVMFDAQPCSVREMMREIHCRGWEVGLHASWNSFNSVAEMKRQKEQVEEAIGATVRSVRHHHLHFDIRCTPHVHHEAGLRVDSSVGFNDDIGFRYGTSLPWRLRDVRNDEPLDVLELPLVIQEKCLIRILAQGRKNEALERADRLIRRVRAVGGLLTLLWHPETIRFPIFVEVYRSLLASLRDQGAWFGTMAEVDDWWRRRMLA